MYEISELLDITTYICNSMPPFFERNLILTINSCVIIETQVGIKTEHKLISHLIGSIWQIVHKIPSIFDVLYEFQYQVIKIWITVPFESLAPCVT